MRTTLNLDDDVLDEVKSYADTRKLALGKAASDLLRRGLNFKVPTRIVNGIVVFDVPDAPVVTTEQIKELLDSEL